MVSLLSLDYFSSLRYFSSPFITVASEHLVAFNLSVPSKRFCLEALGGHPKHCHSTERSPKGVSTDADNQSSLRHLLGKVWYSMFCPQGWAWTAVGSQCCLVRVGLQFTSATLLMSLCRWPCLC